MSVKRSTPNMDYLSSELLAGAGVSQIVRTKDTVYFSGIVAARGQGEVVAPGDVRGQLVFILDVLRQCLAAEGLSFRNVAATTLFCTDIEAVAQNASLFTETFGEHPPTSTWVEVRSLASKDYLAELLATAVID